jgi:hypothetical protein
MQSLLQDYFGHWVQEFRTHKALEDSGNFVAPPSGNPILEIVEYFEQVFVLFGCKPSLSFSSVWISVLAGDHVYGYK